MERKANTSENVKTSSETRKWEYQCIYCSQTFYSGRALGGHQNAHRFETRENKRTHHLRIPRRDQSGVQLSSQVSVPVTANPSPSVQVPSNGSGLGHAGASIGATGSAPRRPPVILPRSDRRGIVSMTELGRRGPSPVPVAAPPREARVDHLAWKGATSEIWPEWPKCDPRNMSAETSKVDDGVEVASEEMLEVDLELKL